jgi:hypothetical protein
MVSPKLPEDVVMPVSDAAYTIGPSPVALSTRVGGGSRYRLTSGPPSTGRVGPPDRLLDSRRTRGAVLPLPPSPESSPSMASRNVAAPGHMVLRRHARVLYP